MVLWIRRPLQAGDERSSENKMWAHLGLRGLAANFAVELAGVAAVRRRALAERNKFWTAHFRSFRIARDSSRFLELLQSQLVSSAISICRGLDSQLFNSMQLARSQFGCLKSIGILATQIKTFQRRQRALTNWKMWKNFAHSIEDALRWIPNCWVKRNEKPLRRRPVLNFRSG